VVRFLDRLETDRKQRILKGSGETVYPRDEIMIATPERQATKIKSDLEHRIPNAVSLRCAKAILEYKPIDVVHRITPRALLRKRNTVGDLPGRAPPLRTSAHSTCL